MSKTNHRTDGQTDVWYPAAHSDYCNGKRGERRSVAGEKKYVHSRHRANTKNNLAELAKAEEGTDYTEVIREAAYEDNYQKRTTRNVEFLPWREKRNAMFDRALAGRGYHRVPNTRSQISQDVTDCPGCDICLS